MILVAGARKVKRLFAVTTPSKRKDHGAWSTRSARRARSGMQGFVVLASTDVENELWLPIETMANVVGCRTCGVQAVGYGRSEVQIRGLSVGRRAVWLSRKGGGAVAIWTVRRAPSPESSELIEGSPTRRAAHRICRLISQEGCEEEMRQGERLR